MNSTATASGSLENVYLDNNAATRVDSQVLSAMLPYFRDLFGNPSSSHSFGRQLEDALRQARRRVQELVGAAFDHEIVFTSGGTESNNTAILSALETPTGRNEVITSTVEHPAVLTLCAHLEQNRGIKVHRIPVDAAGRLDIEAYRQALGPKTAIVSCMWGNNETGTIFPVEQLAEMAHVAGALFHTDAVQAVGKINVTLLRSHIDMASFSAHKFHGPKGIGALYVRKGTRFTPLIRGGRQERGRRAGTENIPAIVGFGKAAELARGCMPTELPRIRALRDRLQEELLRRVSGAIVLGDRESRLPNTLNIGFEYLESDEILILLDRARIAASSGSACTTGMVEPSHVLRAMKVPYTVARGAVRFSFSRENSERDVDHVLNVLPGIVEKLRAVRPAVPGWAANVQRQSASAG
jgi:cysteine desulfurase